MSIVNLELPPGWGKTLQYVTLKKFIRIHPYFPFALAIVEDFASRVFEDLHKELKGTDWKRDPEHFEEYNSVKREVLNSFEILFEMVVVNPVQIENGAPSHEAAGRYLAEIPHPLEE